MIGRGSEWPRWEPHIHAPGTVLNNQFGGGSPWDTYLTNLESVTPKIEALAVTDYYLTDTYEEVLKHKAAGRLSDVQLTFPPGRRRGRRRTLLRGDPRNAPFRVRGRTGFAVTG